MLSSFLYPYNLRSFARLHYLFLSSKYHPEVCRSASTTGRVSIIHTSYIYIKYLFLFIPFFEIPLIHCPGHRFCCAETLSSTLY